VRKILCVALLASAMAAPTAAEAARTRHIHHLHGNLRPSAAGTGLAVSVDQAKLVTLARPAKTIVVGNPTFADLSIIDSRHAFILGKTMGVTNLIALDADGHQISNQQVTVVNDREALTFDLGPSQYNYTCSRGHCENLPRPGDPVTYVTNTEQAIATHEDAATKNATGTPAGQQVPVD
jgi:hypothetical protein